MRIAIIADKFAVNSSIKLEDIELLKKYKPDALKIRDEEGNDLFAIDYKAGQPSISKFGVTFSAVAGRTAKVALTGEIPAGTSNPKEFVADRVGVAVDYINQLENEIPAVVETIKATRKTLMDGMVDALADTEEEVSTTPAPATTTATRSTTKKK